MEEQRLLRSRRLVTTAVRSLVRPATLWMRVVSMASARVIAGKMVVSRPGQHQLSRPWRTKEEDIMAERLHHVQLYIYVLSSCRAEWLLYCRNAISGG
jgi:hypothetical protein